MSSHISAFKNTGATVSVPQATSVEAVRNTFTNVAATITWTGTTIAIEVINDDITNNLAVNFSGAAAAIPGNSSSKVNNHLILPKEARFFQVAVASMSIIASAASVQGRVTAWE